MTRLVRPQGGGPPEWGCASWLLARGATRAPVPVHRRRSCRRGRELIGLNVYLCDELAKTSLTGIITVAVKPSEQPRDRLRAKCHAAAHDRAYQRLDGQKRFARPDRDVQVVAFGGIEVACADFGQFPSQFNTGHWASWDAVAARYEDGCLMAGGRQRRRARAKELSVL